MNPSDSQPHDWREWRRFRALALKGQGWNVDDIAVALDASPSAVHRWLHTAAQSGPDALYAHPPPGRPAKLTSAQWQLLPDLLWHGPEACGLRGNVWTCERVAGALG